MSSITIHNLDERLNILLRKKAKEDGKSLNKTIQDLLRQSFVLEWFQNQKTLLKNFAGYSMLLAGDTSISYYL